MDKKKILYMSELGILTAILLLMQFTPLGYLRIPGITITFLTIPVAVGSVLLGPLAGVILGFVFGATSLLQCFMGDPFGSTILAINPVFTAILCIIPRMLVGLVPALIVKAFKNKQSIVSFGLATVSASITNTVLFIGGFLLFFGTSDFAVGLIDTMGQGNILLFAVAFTGLNAVIEAIACCLIGTALAKGLFKAVNSKFLF